MNQIRDLQELINTSISEINLNFKPTELYEPIIYSLSNGGKRLRPLLALVGCDLFNGKIEDALQLAIGMEIFHNFTLVHDDIMDNAPLRRGKETVYKKWDQNIAILSGDTMFALAYHHICSTKPDVLPMILEVFNQTAREVCEGQQYDMNFEGQKLISLKDYIEMIRLKTGVLLGCCLKAGALCGGASAESAQYLYEFGVNLGISFQIKDDYLDIFGNEEAFGKLNCGDIIARKKTFLYLKALEIAGIETRNEIIRVYNDLSISDNERVKLIKYYFIELGIKEVAELEMERFYSLGLEFLKKIEIPEEQFRLLLSISTSMMERSH